MDNTSLAYKEGIYADIFEAARSTNLHGDAVVKYSESLYRLRDYKIGLQQKPDEARAEGIEIGEARGEAKERRNSIKTMWMINGFTT